MQPLETLRMLRLAATVARARVNALLLVLLAAALAAAVEDRTAAAVKTEVMKIHSKPVS